MHFNKLNVAKTLFKALDIIATYSIEQNIILNLWIMTE